MSSDSSPGPGPDPGPGTPIARAVLPPPSHLVEDGQIAFGTYGAPIPFVNLLDAQPYALPLPRAVRWARLKEWQAFQFGDERVFVNVALFNAKTLALAQVKVYDRRSKQKHLFERKLAPWTLRAPTDVLDSSMIWEGRGAVIHFHNHMGALDGAGEPDGHLDISVHVEAHAGFPGLQARVCAHVADCEPQVVAIPFDERRGMVSHKGCFPLDGSLELGGESLEFSPRDAFLLMDDHKGYYAYVMRWDWVTGGGLDSQGRKIGFNLTRNASRDPEHYNENCVWVDGALHLLPPVEFTRHPERSPEVWAVRDRCGKVAVDFEVEVDGDVRVNAIVAESRYRGPFGRVRGFVETAQGERVELDGMFGMAEDFHLRC